MWIHKADIFAVVFDDFIRIVAKRLYDKDNFAGGKSFKLSDDGRSILQTRMGILKVVRV